MVKLTPEQQADYVRTKPKVFAPVKGGWGKSGCTNVRLSTAPKSQTLAALVAAWRNTAPKRLAASRQSVGGTDPPIPSCVPISWRNTRAAGR
jgi:hypothetical protein